MSTQNLTIGGSAAKGTGTPPPKGTGSSDARVSSSAARTQQASSLLGSETPSSKPSPNTERQFSLVMKELVEPDPFFDCLSDQEGSEDTGQPGQGQTVHCLSEPTESSPEAPLEEGESPGESSVLQTTLSILGKGLDLAIKHPLITGGIVLACLVPAVGAAYAGAATVAGSTAVSGAVAFNSTCAASATSSALVVGASAIGTCAAGSTCAATTAITCAGITCAAAPLPAVALLPSVLTAAGSACAVVATAATNGFNSQSAVALIPSALPDATDIFAHTVPYPFDATSAIHDLSSNSAVALIPSPLPVAPDIFTDAVPFTFEVPTPPPVAPASEAASWGGSLTSAGFAAYSAIQGALSARKKYREGDLRGCAATIGMTTAKLLVTAQGLGLPIESALQTHFPGYFGQAKAAMDSAGGAFEAMQQWSGIDGSAIAALKASSPWFEGAWNYAEGAVRNGATGVSDHPCLTGIVLAIGTCLMAEKLIPSAPVDSASDSSKETKLYTREGVRCKKGKFNIKVPGPAGLSPEHEEDLINAFIQEVLDKNPVHTIPGDTIEFQFNEPKEWTVNVKPKDGVASGRTLQGKKSYNESPSHFASVQKLDALRTVMVKNGKSTAVMTDLRSITTDRIPSNAPAVFPVTFTCKESPELCATMHAMLAIPATRAAMLNSHHPEVNRIANTYQAKLERGDSSGPIDLTNLEKDLNPKKILQKKKTKNANEYEEALFQLMTSYRDDLRDVFAKKTEISEDDELPIEKVANQLNQAAPTYNRLEITIHDSANNTDSLQTLVNAKGALTRFDEVPEFLQISLGEETVERDVDESLDLDWSYINGAPSGGPNKLTYRLQNIVLKDDDGPKTAYQRTVENINGAPRSFYWKIDLKMSTAPILIEKEKFLQEAKSTEQKELFFLKEEEGIAQEGEVLGEPRFDADSEPAIGDDSHKSGITFWVYDNTKNELLSIMQKAADEKKPAELSEIVLNALQIATEDQEEISIPVPVGSEADGINWPLGIVSFAVQEFMKDPDNQKRFKKITLTIDKSKKGAEKKTNLLLQIQNADQIYQNAQKTSNPLEYFNHEWRKICKSQSKRGKSNEGSKGRFW